MTYALKELARLLRAVKYPSQGLPANAVELLVLQEIEGSLCPPVALQNRQARPLELYAISGAKERRLN